MCVYVCDFCSYSFIHSFIPFLGEGLSWEALGCAVLWAPLPAASGYWYLRDCPHQKRWKKKIAQKFCLLKLQKGTCSSTFCAVFCFTGFLTGEETKPSLWLPGHHSVLTAWSVASVAMYMSVPVQFTHLVRPLNWSPHPVSIPVFLLDVSTWKVSQAP